MKRYNPHEIEAKWQKKWSDEKSYVINDNDPRPKRYHLVEFPYPSGSGLHVGHTRSYINFDVMTRWRRMSGENVLYPMGWDSFGLPSEQYAIKTGIHPAKVTEENINTFRTQAKALGLSFDWSREFSTTDPKVYKWTQWIFLNLFKQGLAYQAESLVWWCEELKSVLADEEVINGRSERGDYPCERRPLRQWMLAITKYADRLYDDLEDVDYSDAIKAQQRNWIGRSKGAEISFGIKGLDEKLEVYTTRPDTLFGVTYMVIAPEHPLVNKLTTREHQSEVDTYLSETSKKSDLLRQEETKDKTGVFTGSFAINPLSEEMIPIWVSDYVLMGYGTGAVMAVPAHDERDWKFANKFHLPILRVVSNDEPDDSCTHEEGVIINSGKYNGLKSEAAREQITKDLIGSKKAKEQVNFKLRDWVFSRQRYWGEPFPIVWVSAEDYKRATGVVKEYLPKEPVSRNDEKELAFPVPPDQLPVLLPEVDKFQPEGLGKGPLAQATEWVNVWFNVKSGETVSSTSTKPSGDDWVRGTRETDTMPNWAGSSWYYLRYLDPNNDNQLAAQDKIKAWMPVNWYNGGAEHTTLHLLYSRFWHKFLFDRGVVNTKEPYTKRTNHGIILAEDKRKMSKSWGNVVDPMSIIKDYGTDTLRLYIGFIGPFEQAVAWNINGVAGCRRFIERLWTISQEYIEQKPSDLTLGAIENRELAKVIAETNKSISTDLSEMGFNTAVASLMSAVNRLYKIRVNLPFDKAQSDWCRTLSNLYILLAPFIPHLAEELWQQIGNSGLVLNQTWPLWNDADLKEDNMVIVLQVNGKFRGELKLDKKLGQAEIEKIAKNDPKVVAQVKGKTIKKVIYVPEHLLNFVTD